MAKQNKVVSVLVELRMQYELDDGEDEDEIVDRINTLFEEMEHGDDLNIDGATPRSLMVHTDQGETTMVDEDASW